MATKGGSGVIYTNDTKEKRGLRMENPFTLKVGQVFTGFGIGCGIGIGVGRPLNLGAIPVLNQVMIATRGATDAFSGVQRHVNNSLKRVGAKNIEAGVGCGVGFGHGFGVGLAVKTSVLHQIQSNFLQLAAGLMVKLGIDSSSSSSVNQGIVPASLQTGISMVKEPLHENPAGSISQLVKSVSNSSYDGSIRDEKAVVSSGGTLAPKSSAVNTQYSSRTETVLNNFLKNPLLKEEGSSPHEQFPLQAGALRLENNVLQMVLKHQVLIEELMQENEKLRQILMEELKVQPSKLQSNFTSRSKFSCTECFECRRKQRKR
ncbi:hypothetical protein DH2020_048798 [Rehmannia glutinosa]|uniref:Uncharacterized protein n=1 Tax=Rehmannia glutinosa TaxID=99300 RepID=A0ABR0U4Q9_REHGL